MSEKDKSAKSSKVSRVRPVVESPTLQSVRRKSVVDEVTEQLTQRIVAGEWPPGFALPGLRTLASELGVAMPTVREAVRTLQGQGLLEARHGSGTYVRDIQDNESIPWMLDPREEDEYLELMEARTLIEGELVRLAHERATAEERARLLDVAREMEEARSDVRAFMEADLKFHIVLAEAAHNRTLLRTMLAIRGPLRRFIHSRALRQIQDVGNLDLAVADHRAVAESIASGDAKGGSAAMRRIVTRGRSHVIESVTASAEQEPSGVVPMEPVRSRRTRGGAS